MSIESGSPDARGYRNSGSDRTAYTWEAPLGWHTMGEDTRSSAARRTCLGCGATFWLSERHCDEWGTVCPACGEYA
ncbi:hypothetical protein BRC85_08225 [Halobacteriales archaeon QS_1_69_70]|nr:MAG: hypothetical protein BRC85_08225 [Halobacteriales archaeon QS_1_69_70]